MHFQLDSLGGRNRKIQVPHEFDLELLNEEITAIHGESTSSDDDGARVRAETEPSSAKG